MVDGNTSKREGVQRFLRWRARPDKHASNAHEPSPQQVYAEWMKTAFGPALRAEGMRGSGGRFEFPSELVWAQLGFQKSTYSDSREVRFTVNLSVIRRDVWAEQSSAHPYLGERPKPTYRYGSWADQARLGAVSPGGKDTWYRIVRGAAHLDVVRDAALHDLLTYGVPWLRERIG